MALLTRPTPRNLTQTWRETLRELDKLAAEVVSADNWWTRGMRIITLFLGLMLLALIGYVLVFAFGVLILLVAKLF